MALSNAALEDEAQRMNFWTGGNFVVDRSTCTGIVQDGLQVRANCKVKDKDQTRDVLVPFPSDMLVDNEVMLKNALVAMATKLGRLQDTADIVDLQFGKDLSLPLDFKFNNVPHYGWVRAYMYEAAVQAVVNAIYDPTVPNKSRLQLKVNYPEVNPAFDTYRIGTVLEMVRAITLKLTQDGGKRVRICVQQSLGRGIFVGMPLALSAMRPALERMDWGGSLTAEEKYQQADNQTPRKEALVRLGTVGAEQVAEDDDVIFVIAPQNVIGGMVIELLEEMVNAAKGRPVILINPLLEDRPSSDNMMQIRGRSERRAFSDSFTDIYCFRLLYPSSGGYMYPISGLVAKNDFHSPWVAYAKEEIADEKSSTGATREQYKTVAAFDPYSAPKAALLSGVFTGRR